MNQNVKYALAAMLLAGFNVPVMAQDRRGDDYSEKYGILTDKNIFLKDRPRPRPPSSTSRSTRNERPVVEEPIETRFVLRGVVIEDNELRAYFEDSRNNRMTTVVPGESIARGHIIEIAIDAVRYEYEGRVTWVEIGHNLAGVRQTTAAPVRSSGSGEASTSGSSGSGSGNGNSGGTAGTVPAERTGTGTTGGTAAEGTPAAPVDTANMSVEERLRLRRQNERTRGN